MENTQNVTGAAGALFAEGAALVDHEKTILTLSGRKSPELLNAVLTNVLPGDERGGVYAALLNSKGRVQADLRILKSGEQILVVTEPEGAAAAAEILGRYAPFSRVEIEDRSAEWSVLGLYGPRATELLGGLAPVEHETAEIEIGGAPHLAVGVRVPVPGYDLIHTREAIHAVREHLTAAGATPSGQDAYETARIAAGIPRFGFDITPENFPNESDSFLQRAVSFEKGCYPGQETVARMRYRGNPNKHLYRLELEGPAPQPGTEIKQDGKTVGLITSVAPLPMEERTLALGYLSRSADPDGDLDAGNTTVRKLNTA
jgi:folate-binding protein YgfZ